MPDSKKCILHPPVCFSPIEEQSQEEWQKILFLFTRISILHPPVCVFSKVLQETLGQEIDCYPESLRRQAEK